MDMLSQLKAIGKLIGRTPIFKLEKIVPSDSASIYLKLEYMNPGGSHKDRIAYYMLKEAIEKGKLKKGSYVIEVSSGNTALSLAWMSARLGLKTIFIVEYEISPAKIALLKLLNSKVLRIKSNLKKDLRVLKAKELEKKLGGLYINQFSNEANFKAHYETTAKEIVEQLKKRIDAFVMGIGTGGTIAGVSKYLKEKIGKKVFTVGVVPKGSSIIHGEKKSDERIEGLAKDIIPEIFVKYKNYIDEIVEVREKDAIDTVKKLASKEGLFVGPSTGANVFVALKIAKELGPGKNVVTIAADSLLRYPHLLFQFKNLRKDN
jgi:cysteine synthase A